MKKYIFLFAIAIVATFTSCSNDEIEISRSITFKVNPATVVDNLYERNAGDLTSLGSKAQLIVSLFIYDENGVLVDNISNEYSAYTHMMTTDIYLPSGKYYTAVATTNVKSSVDFWTFSGTDQLSTFKITDNGYVGGKDKILGLTIKSFSVGDNSETVNIDVKNAGAVGLVQFYQWNKYYDVSEYALLGKQACDYVSFDNQGNADYSLKSESTYNFIKIAWDYDSKYTGASGYFFTFPIKNASFSFSAYTTAKKWVSLATFVDNVNLGETYWFLYDFENDEAYWFDMTPNGTRSCSQNIVPAKYLNNENYRIMYDYDGQSIAIN